MRTIELTDEEHDILTRLAYDGTRHPLPLSGSNSSIRAANTLCLRLRPHLEDAEEIADVRFIDKMCSLFGELPQFDEMTGEQCMFKESLEALQRQLPQALKKEPLVVGTLLVRIMSNPSCAGLIITEAYNLGGRMAIR